MDTDDCSGYLGKFVVALALSLELELNSYLTSLKNWPCSDCVELDGIEWDR